MLLRRTALALLTAAVAVLATPTPARADSTISLNAESSPGAVNCPQTDEAVWIFAARDTPLTHAGNLLVVQATFAVPDGTHASIVANPSPIQGLRNAIAHNQATIATEPGWSLVDATATITGPGGYLELVGYCPATPTPSTTTVKPATTPAVMITPRRAVAAPIVPAPVPRQTTAHPQRRAAAAEIRPARALDVGSTIILGTAFMVALMLLLATRRLRTRSTRRRTMKTPDPRRAMLVQWHD